MEIPDNPGLRKRTTFLAQVQHYGKSDRTRAGRTRPRTVHRARRLASMALNVPPSERPYTTQTP